MLAAVLLVLLETSAPTAAERAAPVSIQDQFVGTWRLVSDVEERGGGQSIEPRGPHPIGVLIYDRAGTMSGQIMNSGRPALSTGSADCAALEQTIQSYLAYFGTYTIDEQARTITHHVRGSLVQTQVGSAQLRRYEFRGNRLTLSPPERTVDGIRRTRRITWERVP
jgi:hypothetical protein